MKWPYISREWLCNLGCIWIGWKWFPKMFFRKCGCLVAHGKYIFRKCFPVLTCLWCKMISVFILHSNTIFRKIERERERERERECVCVWVRSRLHAKRERERERGIRESPLPTTHKLRLCRQPRDFAPRTQITVRLRLRIAPFDFADEPRGQDRTPSTSHPSTSPTSHAFNFAEMAPRRHRSHWVRNWEMVGFWWIWPGLMNFFWLGFDEFDRVYIYLLRNGIIYLFGSWENVRKCKKQEENVFSILFSATQPNTRKYFPKHFSECNQTLENIFLSRK